MLNETASLSLSLRIPLLLLPLPPRSSLSFAFYPHSQRVFSAKRDYLVLSFTVPFATVSSTRKLFRIVTVVLYKHKIRVREKNKRIAHLMEIKESNAKIFRIYRHIVNANNFSFLSKILLRVNQTLNRRFNSRAANSTFPRISQNSPTVSRFVKTYSRKL